MIANLCRQHGEAAAIADAKRTKVRARIVMYRRRADKAEAKIGGMYAPHWSDAVLAPLAEKCRELIGGTGADVSGPFGIGATCSIGVYNEEPDEFDGKKCILCVSFRFDHKGNRLLLLDRSSIVYPYGPDTLGALNELQYATPDVTDWTPEQIVEWAKRREEAAA